MSKIKIVPEEDKDPHWQLRKSWREWLIRNTNNWTNEEIETQLDAMLKEQIRIHGNR